MVGPGIQGANRVLVVVHVHWGSCLLGCLALMTLGLHLHSTVPRGEDLSTVGESEAFSLQHCF